MTFGERLVNLRENSNVSKTELAEKTGVSCKVISKWEDDEVYPNIKEVVEMSQIFQVPVEQMIADLELDDKTVPKKFDKETKGIDGYFRWLSFFVTVMFILGVTTLILDHLIIGEAFFYYFSLIMITIAIVFFFLTWISILRK